MEFFWVSIKISRKIAFLFRRFVEKWKHYKILFAQLNSELLFGVFFVKKTIAKFSTNENLPRNPTNDKMLQ